MPTGVLASSGRGTSIADPLRTSSGRIALTRVPSPLQPGNRVVVVPRRDPRRRARRTAAPPARPPPRWPSRSGRGPDRLGRRRVGGPDRSGVAATARSSRYVRSAAPGRRGVVASRWTQQGSNLRPTPCKGAALPAELWVRAGRPRPNQPNDRDHSPVALRSDVSARARAPAPPPPRRPTRARRATAKPARRDPAVRRPTPPVRRTHRRGTRSRPVGVPASLTHRRCTGRGLPSSPGCVGSRGRPTPAGRPAPRSSTVTAPGPGQSGGRSNGRRASIPLIWRLSRPSLMRWRRSPRLDAGYSEASTLTYSAWSRASDSAFTTLYRTMPALSMMNVARNAAPLLSSKTP